MNSFGNPKDGKWIAFICGFLILFLTVPGFCGKSLQEYIDEEYDKCENQFYAMYKRCVERGEAPNECQSDAQEVFDRCSDPKRIQAFAKKQKMNDKIVAKLTKKKEAEEDGCAKKATASAKRCKKYRDQQLKDCISGVNQEMMECVQGAKNRFLDAKSRMLQ